MCFSASASFTAGGVLAISGVATLTKVKSKRELPLALIPIAFAIQQFIEGIQWLVDKPSTLSIILGYAYISFALLLWPIIIPLAAALIEKHAVRRRIIIFTLVTGCCVAAVALVFLIKNPLTVAVHQCLKYDITIPISLGIVPYIIAICVGPFVSSYKIIRMLSVGVFISLLISWQFYANDFGSVWCFCAAVLSLAIYIHFRYHAVRRINS